MDNIYFVLTGLTILGQIVLPECEGEFEARANGVEAGISVWRLIHDGRFYLHAQVIIHGKALDKFGIDIGIYHLDAPAAEETQNAQVAIAAKYIGIGEDVGILVLGQGRITPGSNAS